MSDKCLIIGVATVRVVVWGAESVFRSEKIRRLLTPRNQAIYMRI